jgi:hypothetical protein
MKEINNYPNYQVGIDGTVISYKFSKQKVLKPQMVTQSKKKYLAVGLYNENNKRTKYGKTPAMNYVHRLVWEAFVGEIPEHLEIEHIDQNPHNCHLSNLKLVTRKENIDSHYRSKYGFLYTEKRDEIIQDYLQLKSYDLVAEKWNVNVSTIFRVIKNKKAKIVDGKYTLIDAGTADDFFTQKDLRITGTRKEIDMTPAYTYKKKKS